MPVPTPEPAATNEFIKWIAIGFQTIGLLFTLAGVVVVRAWIEELMAATAAAGRSVGRWLGLQIERVIQAVTGRRVATLHAVTASARMRATGGLTATATHARVDRDTIDTRDWLADLDDRVEALRVLADKLSAQQAETLQTVHQQLEAQGATIRQELREAILQTARDGWKLIVVGLILSLIGTVLAGFV